MTNLDLSWFDSPEDEAQLQRLIESIDELSSKDAAGREFEELLNVFERFPDDDGFKVFWSIVHFLEHCQGYEPALVESVRRAPVEFNLLMINRLLNGGIEFIGEQSLIELLETVAKSNAASDKARQTAAHFLDYQRSK